MVNKHVQNYVTRSVNYASQHFTLIEMLVVIAIIAILASMLAPALRDALESAKTVGCANNLRQSSLIVNYYCDDYNNLFPELNLYSNNANDLQYWITQYGDITDTKKSIMWCTADERPRGARNDMSVIHPLTSVRLYSSYGGHAVNANTGIFPWATARDISRSSLKTPTKTIMMSEISSLWYFGRWQQYFYVLHNGGSNYIVADGHTEYANFSEPNGTVMGSAYKPFSSNDPIDAIWLR